MKMKTKRTEKKDLIGLISVFLVLTLTIFVCPGNAAIPPTINYQGYLTNASGAPVNATIQMTFAVYDIDVGGAPLWTETRSVTVSQGVYNVNLGEVTPMNLPFDTQYFLGVQIGTDPEMTPRKVLTSVGYAFRAFTVESIGSHTHSVSDITGTIMETLIDTSIARDSEVASAISVHAANPSAHHTRYTDAEAVAATKAADGAGSGLDADLLDGQDSAYYLSLTNHSGILPVSNGGTGSGTKNFVDLSTSQTIGGIKTFSSRITSTVPTGMAPFQVSSTTLVPNLNSERVGGYSVSDLDGRYVNELQANSVTAIMIAGGAVVNSKLATDSVGTSQIINGAVTTAKVSPTFIKDLLGLQLINTSTVIGSASGGPTRVAVNVTCPTGKSAIACGFQTGQNLWHVEVARQYQDRCMFGLATCVYMQGGGFVCPYGQETVQLTATCVNSSAF